LELVPEATMPWNPEIAPHATVMKSSGNILGVPGAVCVLNARAVMSGMNKRTAPYSSARPTINCIPLIKSLGCRSIHTGSIDAIAAQINRMIIPLASGVSPIKLDGSSHSMKVPIQMDIYKTITPTKVSSMRLKFLRSN
jgi:hypothetical protein